MPVDSGTIYSEIRIKLDKLTGDIKSIGSEFDKLEKGTEKTEKAVTKGFEGINLAGVAAFAAIAAGIKGSIEAFSEYEDAMAGVHAVMNGTEADFNTLENAALKAGSTTDFSAKTSAEALKVFAKAGFDANTSMQLLESTMTLAKASGTELSVTAQILKTTLTQFSLGADQADRVANVFAASKIPLQELSDTMRVIGPIASGMGFSMEEVVSAVKMMAKAGIDGSTSGSSLRLVLSEIGDSTSAMSKKLVEYGVDLDKVNPKTNSLAQIIGELSKAGIGAQESLAIFGARAGGAMSVLIGQGQTAIEEYTKSITGTNEALRQAEIMDNTLGDATKTMANAFEVAGIGLIKELNPAIRFLVDIVTKAVQFFTELPGPVKMFFGIAAVGIPVIMGLSAAFGVLAGLVTAAAAPIIAVVGGIAAIVALGSAVYSSIDNEANITKRLDKSSADLSKTLADLKKIKEELTDKNKKLNETEQKSLDIQRQKLELDKQTNLKKVIEDYNKYDGVIKKNGEQIALNDRYLKDFDATNARFIKNTGKADSTITAQAQSYKNLNIELKNKNILIDQDKQKTVDALALQVKSGEISLEDIMAYNKELANKVAIAWTHLDQLDAEAKKTGDVTAAKSAQIPKTAEQAAIEKALADAREDATKKALADIKDYIEKTEDLKATEEEQIELARRRAIAEVMASKASEDSKQKELDALNKYYDALKDDKALKEKTDNEKKAVDEIKARNDKLKSDIEGFIGGLAGAFQGLFSAIYDQRMKDLDNQMKAEMEAAGVQTDTAVQTAQKELDAARAGGDAQVIAEKEKALKRAQIEADYEKKKAKLSYEGAHLQWQLTLANAWAQAAMVQINAWNSMPWPFNLVPMVLGGIMSGIQIGAIMAAEPKAPTFESGGIVPGEQYSGDHINARLNSKEMVINQQQQAALWNFIRNGSRGNGDININNQFGDVRSDVDMERTSRKMARQVAGAQRSR